MKKRLKQAEAVYRAVLRSLQTLDVTIPLKQTLKLVKKNSGSIIITGVGKSVFIGKKLCATLTSLGIKSYFLHPTDALHGDSGRVLDGDILVVFSFSGESKEVVDIVKYLSKNFSINIVSITTLGSTLSRVSQVTFPLKIKDEGSPLGLAPMASTTTSLVIADMLAAVMVDAELFTKEHFTRFHPGGTLGLKILPVEKVMLKGSALPMIDETASFLEAVKIIDKKKKGVIAVVKNRMLTGVITDGDIRRLILKKGDFTKLLVANAMTRNPKTISGRASLHEALKKMEMVKITTLFVVDEKCRPIGLIHMHDIINRSLS